MAPVAEDRHDALPLERWVERFLAQDPTATYLALPVSCARVENLPPGGLGTALAGRCGASSGIVAGVVHYCLLAPHDGRVGCGWDDAVADGHPGQFAAQVDPVARIERDARFALEQRARDMPGAYEVPAVAQRSLSRLER